MKTAAQLLLIISTVALFASTSSAQKSENKQKEKTEVFDEKEFYHSMDTALAKLEAMGKDDRLMEKISKVVDQAMKSASRALADAQVELKHAEDTHAIDSAMKQSTQALSESKRALNAAAKALKDSDAIKHAGNAFDEAVRAFEKAMQEFDREMDKK